MNSEPLLRKGPEGSKGTLRKHNYYQALHIRAIYTRGKLVRVWDRFWNVGLPG